MQQRRKFREKGPLLVKEVILPEKEKPSCSNSVTLPNSPRRIDETTSNSPGSCLTIGNHTVKSIIGVTSFEKKVEEDYFRGTKKEKCGRRKKHQKVNNSLNELLFEKSQNKSKESKVPNVSLIDIIQQKRCRDKIQSYEKMRKHSDSKLQIKQRLAEKKYIEQQENLAETWLENMKIKNQKRENDWLDSKPELRETFYNDRISISIISRKYWNDDNDHSTLKKKEKKSKTKKIVDDLSEEIFGKLVFVDDDDNDDDSDDEVCNVLKNDYNSRCFFNRVKH